MSSEKPARFEDLMEPSEDSFETMMERKNPSSKQMESSEGSSKTTAVEQGEEAGAAGGAPPEEGAAMEEAAGGEQPSKLSQDKEEPSSGLGDEEAGAPNVPLQDVVEGSGPDAQLPEASGANPTQEEEEGRKPGPSVGTSGGYGGEDTDLSEEESSEGRRRWGEGSDIMGMVRAIVSLYFRMQDLQEQQKVAQEILLKAASKGHLPAPTTFSGDRRQYHEFIVLCQLILQSCPSDYRNDQQRVSYIIGHMSGMALEWAQRLVREGSPLVDNFSAFLEAMSEMFEYRQARRVAEDAMFTLRQGDRGALEYVTEFRGLVSNLSWPDEVLQAHLCQGLNDDIRHYLFRVPQPSSLDSLISLVLQIEEKVAERKAILRLPPASRPRNLTWPDAPAPERWSVSSWLPWESSPLVDRHHLFLLMLVRVSPYHSVAVRALVDSGATGNYMDETFAQEHYVELYEKTYPQSLRMVDGGQVGSDPVWFYTEPLVCIHQNHQESLEFDIVPSPNFSVILGVKWLRTHLPEIDWAQGRCTFHSPYCMINCFRPPPPCIALESHPVTLLPGLPPIYSDLADVFNPKEDDEETSDQPSSDGSDDLSESEPSELQQAGDRDHGGDADADADDEGDDEVFYDCLSTASWERAHANARGPGMQVDDAYSHSTSSSSNTYTDIDIYTEYSHGRVGSWCGGSQDGYYSPSWYDSPKHSSEEDEEDEEEEDDYDEEEEEWFYDSEDEGQNRGDATQGEGQEEEEEEEEFMEAVDLMGDAHDQVQLIPQLFDPLHGATLFSKLELRGTVVPDGIDKTEAERIWRAAFGLDTIPRRHYKRFDVCPDPTVRQNAVFTILGGLLGRNVLTYGQEVVIFSMTQDEHVHIIRKVLGRFRRHKLYCSLEHTQFHRRSVEFLGFLLSPEGVRLNKTIVSTVAGFQAPGTKHGVRHLVEFMLPYRNFIPRYAVLAEPIARQLITSRPFRWGAEEQEAFEALKRAFRTAPLLRHPRPQHPFFLETGSTPTAIHSTLIQVEEETGRRVSCAFYSRNHCPAEATYSALELKILPVRASFMVWSRYLENTEEPIMILTNTEDLASLNNDRLTVLLPGQWAFFFSQFHFDLMERPEAEDGRPPPPLRHPARQRRRRRPLTIQTLPQLLLAVAGAPEHDDPLFENVRRELLTLLPLDHVLSSLLRQLGQVQVRAVLLHFFRGLIYFKNSLSLAALLVLLHRSMPPALPTPQEEDEEEEDEDSQPASPAVARPLRARSLSMVFGPAQLTCPAIRAALAQMVAQMPRLAGQHAVLAQELTEMFMGPHIARCNARLPGLPRRLLFTPGFWLMLCDFFRVRATPRARPGRPRPGRPGRRLELHVRGDEVVVVPEASLEALAPVLPPTCLPTPPPASDAVTDATRGVATDATSGTASDTTTDATSDLAAARSSILSDVAFQATFGRLRSPPGASGYEDDDNPVTRFLSQVCDTVLTAQEVPPCRGRAPRCTVGVQPPSIRAQLPTICSRPLAFRPQPPAPRAHPHSIRVQIPSHPIAIRPQPTPRAQPHSIREPAPTPRVHPHSIRVQIPSMRVQPMAIRPRPPAVRAHPHSIRGQPSSRAHHHPIRRQAPVIMEPQDEHPEDGDQPGGQ